MKKKLIIGIILIMCIVIILAILKNNKSIHNNNVEGNNTNSILQQEENSNKGVSSLNIESEEVQALYKIPLKYNELGADVGDVFKDIEIEIIDTSFYHNEKVTLDTLNNEEKIIAVLANVNEEEIEKSSFSKLLDVIPYAEIWFKYFEDYPEMEIEEEDKDRTVEIYTAETLKNTAKRIFGSDVEIEYKTLDLCGTAMDYKDGNYYKYDYEGGGLGYTEKAYSKLIKAEQQNDYIYLYDKFVYCDSEKYWTDTGDLLFYTSVNKIEPLDVNWDTEETDVDKIGEEILSKYENQLNTYKHTFKKGIDNQYYWISTEIFK